MGAKVMPIVTVNEHKWFLDGYHVYNLDCIKRDVRKDYDAWVIYDGLERSGKSTFAAQSNYYCDPNFNIDRVAFTASQLVTALYNCPKYGAVQFDEAFKYLSSRRSMSLFNWLLVAMMSEIGYKNLIVTICIPTFFELDKYPAIHRSIGLIHIKERGRFSSYDYEQKKKLYLYGKKGYNYWAVRGSFFGNFTKFFPLPKEEYEKRKAKHAGMVDDLKDEVAKIREAMKQRGEEGETKLDLINKNVEEYNEKQEKRMEEPNGNNDPGEMPAL